ncbi:MAG: ATP-binding cassette domain-containing protein [Treponema sp.]|jgi:cobalt/nickel transport system ATP-binding protein|nr:ATP-binding cassette domain-containing protein [Treponema sp.]
MNKEELLRAENISYRYDDKYLALNNVHVTFHKGERIAVLGGNGAGKSTFFLCCNGVLRPQKGSIFYKGREISNSKKDILVLRQGVGLVFQDPDSQIIAGSVESEVSFGPMNLRLSRDEVVRRVEQSMTQMNLMRYKNNAPQYLSGGEKKRVSIADILAMQPEMILLDEPTASLDPENVEALENILDELNDSGITIVISTHDVNFAYRFAERAVIFTQGEIIADAAIDEVFVSETVLKKAGLKKPLLYEAFECVQSSNPNRSGQRKPKTIEEFKAYIGES